MRNLPWLLLLLCGAVLHVGWWLLVARVPPWRALRETYARHVLLWRWAWKEARRG